jgi:hypothetical protein
VRPRHKRHLIPAVQKPLLAASHVWTFGCARSARSRSRGRSGPRLVCDNGHDTAKLHNQLSVAQHRFLSSSQPRVALPVTISSGVLKVCVRVPEYFQISYFPLICRCVRGSSAPSPSVLPEEWIATIGRPFDQGCNATTTDYYSMTAQDGISSRRHTIWSYRCASDDVLPGLLTHYPATPRAVPARAPCSLSAWTLEHIRKVPLLHLV